MKLSAAQREAWARDGCLQLPTAFDASAVAALSAWTDDFAARPETPGRWMKYFEGDGALCRVENLLDYHDGFARLVAGDATLGLAAALLGAPAILFKEKINYKLPGASGFAPHQDAPAFTGFGQTAHVTVMVSIDATTAANGCLEIAPHPGPTVLDLAPDLTIAPPTADALTWRPLPTAPGAVVAFDGYLPHRSGPNGTAAPRRALYLTYARRAEGDHRAAYFRRKREVFPPEVERVAGRDYGDAGVFNVGNPIR